MNKKITDKHFMEVKELEIKTNESVQIQHKSNEKTYSEKEVKEMMIQVIKEMKNETNK